MIKSWKHKGLYQFYLTGSRAGINPEHGKRISMILQLLDVAERPEDLDLPGFHFHKLQGDLYRYFSVRVNGNWRIIYSLSLNFWFVASHLALHLCNK